MLFNNGRTDTNTNLGDIKDIDALIEMYIVDEVSKLPQEKIDEFCKPGGVGETLVEAGKFRKQTLVRLSKFDDQERRTTMAAFQMAREHKDPLWAALAKNRIKERKLIEGIMHKYGMKAQAVAKIGQKEYLKNKMPSSFMRAGGNARL